MAYIFEFPGLNGSVTASSADQQLSACFWAVWHTTFRLLVIVTTVLDPDLRERAGTNRAIARTLGTAIMLSITSSVVTVGAMLAFKTHLPKLVDGGHLTATFSHIVAPGAAALNAACCIALVRRGRNLTALQLWLLVAVVAEMLDSFLNAYAPYRFSYGWYIGKLETVLTSSVVLAVLVSEVTTISRCLTELAVMDSLTGLHNRRAFDEQLETMLRYARRLSSGLGLIVLDVDFFKGYNDAYGHAAGDECLRRIAAVLRTVACRPLDHVSRYGGEEFVILVPDTSCSGTELLAQRLVSEVFRSSIAYASYDRRVVTVSAGTAHIAGSPSPAANDFFELADAALYEAKRLGRNTSVMRETPLAEQSRRDAPELPDRSFDDSSRNEHEHEHEHPATAAVPSVHRISPNPTLLETAKGTTA